MEFVLHVYALQADGTPAPEPIVSIDLADVLPAVFDREQIGRLYAEIGTYAGDPAGDTVLGVDLHDDGRGMWTIDRTGEEPASGGINPAPVFD